MNSVVPLILNVFIISCSGIWMCFFFLNAQLYILLICFSGEKKNNQILGKVQILDDKAAFTIIQSS